MSILNVNTAFTNVSHSPYVIDEFWVNTQGFNTTAASNITLPGLYGQGCSILSCSLITPGNDVSTVLGGNTVTVNALNNLPSGTGSKVLYTALGSSVVSPGSGLGQTLPADSWLQLAGTPSGASGTALPIGLLVKYTNLTVTQPRGY